ncbi:transposase zinc-binding domain-containing protein, partial [Myxococcota bacterium]
MCQTAALTRAGPKPLELADVLTRFANKLAPLRASLTRVVHDIITCRTEALGGHIQQCDRCGHLDAFFNSCRNRHCPKCQSLSQARWLEARQQDLLPVEYFHIVFTIPAVLHRIFRGDPKTAYSILFAAVSETLREVAINPKRLGARIGFTAVLHTWTQTLLYHPHIHCVVPGGGLSLDRTRWVGCKPGYFLPVKKVLSKVFRGKLLDKLEKALNKNAI